MSGESQMSRYSIDLTVMHKPLEVIDLAGVAAQRSEEWWNRTLTQVNSSVVRLCGLHGEFHWHRHDEDDEFFLVLEGRLFIDLEDRVIELGPNQGVTVPKGTKHRPRAPEKSLVLVVETSSIQPTGTED